MFSAPRTVVVLALMSRLSTYLFLLVLTAFITLPLSARGDELHSGERIRVHTTGDDGEYRQLTGTVVSMDEETLVVRTGRDFQPVPLSGISRVDRWAGTERHTFAGTLIGASTGLVLGYFAWQSDENSNDSIVHVNVAPYMMFFGVIGAGLGALIGHAAATETWYPVDSLSVGVAPSGESSAQMAVMLSFDL